jgi:superoxide reductase
MGYNRNRKTIVLSSRHGIFHTPGPVYDLRDPAEYSREKKGVIMAKLVVFKCKKCGSMVVKINRGGCSPSCCGEPMSEVRANDTDGAKEKHVPDVAVEDGVVKVKVGSVEHPMLDAHYITFIALETEKGVQCKFLEPGEAPAADFTLVDDKAVTAYEYCNLHGLWKKDI